MVSARKVYAHVLATNLVPTYQQLRTGQNMPLFLIKNTYFDSLRPSDACMRR